MTTYNISKWDRRFLDLAKFISHWSKDPSTKCGAVIADLRNRIISVGFNGFPVGVNDSEERLKDRETKYSLILHAERNAILFANQPLDGCRLYTYPFMPCDIDAAIIVQVGIAEVISPFASVKHLERWAHKFELAHQIFNEGNVNLILTDYLGGR